jgi:translation initiation factor IF-3
VDNRPINEKIYDQEMLVIDQDGNKLGKLTRQEALQRARDANLDLVLFVSKEKTGSLPIVKIIDFGKFNYEEKLKQKQSKKNQSIILTKEVKVRPQIGNHDLQ